VLEAGALTARGLVALLRTLRDHIAELDRRIEQLVMAVWSKYSRDSAAAVVVYDERSAMRDRFHWARLLSFVTGLVNQELLLRNEYLAAENRILRAHLPARLRLSGAERSTLAEIANDSAARL